MADPAPVEWTAQDVEGIRNLRIKEGQARIKFVAEGNTKAAALGLTGDDARNYMIAWARLRMAGHKSDPPQPPPK